MSQNNVVDSGGFPSTLTQAVVTDIWQATTVSTSTDTRVDKCEACGRVLAVDETFTEHLVSVHLTSEGLCDICGGDSEDFIEHFKMHLSQFRVDTFPPMVSIKAELIDKDGLDDNKNCTFDTNGGCLCVTAKIKVEEIPKTKVETEKRVATKIEEEEEFQKLVRSVSEYSLPCNEQETAQFSCYMCNRKFRQVSQHIALYHCNISYPCSLCDKFTGNRKEMKKHVRSEHEVEKKSGKGEYCSECNKIVAKISDHTKRVHLQMKQHYCNFCEKGFHDKRGFEEHKHKSDSHGHKGEVCEECGLSVKKLQKHILDVHTKKPSQICAVCGKYVSHMRDHLKALHLKVKNFSCPICPLKTYKKGTLNRHMAVHAKYSTMNKPYPHKARKPEYSLEPGEGHSPPPKQI